MARAAALEGRFGQGLSHPVAVAARHAMMRLVPPAVGLRSMRRWARWDAPVVPDDGR